MRQVIGILAVTLALAGTALAQEPPDAVYAKLHRAALAGNLNEMLKHATDARKAEISAMPGGPEIAKLIGAMMPRTYSVASTSIGPDGNTALLRATGQGNFMGQQMHGTVNFMKEKGEWKVDRWEWGDKPGDQVARVQQKPAVECVIKPVMSDDDLKACGATPR